MHAKMMMTSIILSSLFFNSLVQSSPGKSGCRRGVAPHRPDGRRVILGPAVAVREFVPRHARIIDADDETPSGNAVRATADRPTLRLGAHRPAPPVDLAIVRQHRL